MARERALTTTSASYIASYMNEMVEQEKGKGNDVTIAVYQQMSHGLPQGKLANLDTIGVDDIQQISCKEDCSVVVSSTGSKTDMVYAGSNPYEISTITNGKPSVLYLDELHEVMQYAASTPSVQNTKQLEQTTQTTVERKEQEVSESKQQVSEKQVSSGKSEKAYTAMKLVGVSAKSFKVRSDDHGHEYINVAIPWEKSKNNLGYIDIPKAEFDKENTPEAMSKRKTYHIPLNKESYGMWYVDKATDKAVKPQVAAADIKASYEANRAAYRQNRITKENVGAAKSQDVSQQNQQQKSTSVRKGMELPIRMNDDFNDDLDFCCD